MKKPFFLLIAFCAAAENFAMDWPSSNGRLTANFGMGVDGMPLTADVFSASGDVYSADPGTILFFADENGANGFISPLGNWAAVDYDDGVMSVYARLGSLAALPAGGRVEKGATIAAAGRSGWTESEGFALSFFDRRERQWVNPERVLSALPDTLPPSIQSVRLKNTAGQTVDLAQTRSIRQGRYALFVQAADRSENAAGILIPFRVICSLNGIEIGRLELETFNARDGILFIYRNGMVPARQIYSAYPALEAAGDIFFTRGQASLDITVQDFAGNTRAASYRLYVE